MSTISTSVINGTNMPSFYTTPSGITISGTTKRYNTYAEMLEDKNPPSLAYVLDASGDPTVDAGGAFYRWTGTSWKKMYEEEVMDQGIDIDAIRAELDAAQAAINDAVQSVESITSVVETALLPTWIPVVRTADAAVFEVDTRLGMYFAIRITDNEVDTFGKEFEIRFLSDVVGGIYSGALPLDQNKPNIVVDISVDTPSKDVVVVVDGIKMPAPTRLDVYWNGSKAVLDPRLKQLILYKNRIAELETELEVMRTESANIETSFVNDGTEDNPATVQLKDDEWCVMTSPFTATLPENPKNGDSIHMSIEHGNIHMTVVAPNGATINGQAKPCLVGVDETGSPISNVSFYFVFNAAQNNWIVL